MKQPSQLWADHELPTAISASSGVTTASAAQLLGIADRAIVGTALKEGDRTTSPVAVDRVERLTNIVVEDTD